VSERGFRNLHMKVIMTGARGRLGRALRPYFAAKGVEVLSLSRTVDLEHRPLSTLASAAAETTVEAILHLAWSTVPATAENSDGSDEDENLSFLRGYLDAATQCLESGNRLPRRIFFSSCAVYGEPNQAGSVFDESHAPAPIGRYAESKARAEQMLAEYRSIGGDTVVLRVTNPYGFEQKPDNPQGVIPALFHCAVSGTPFLLWGEGDAVKDYIYVDDFCRAVLCALKGPSGVFNIASGESVALSDVISMVEDLTGKDVSVIRKPARPWDVRRGRYSSAAFQKATSWVPQIDFSEGMRRFAGEILALRSAR
jgi:UDP-glucose 4-epimerase